jgi:hypothetical protein
MKYGYRQPSTVGLHVLVALIMGGPPLFWSRRGLRSFLYNCNRRLVAACLSHHLTWQQQQLLLLHQHARFPSSSFVLLPYQPTIKDDVR